ncbi:hypothetical protein [Gloeothece verrucosa]|uniref:Uncharacterized protein n=1 Tax=Gloeothece verrucosa (strain PCC 7822) TaxID=497965 RepID=E0U873_GLOV7|nr:hypothetical protein [Gloeothece verrucosa]ADN17278.1 conserved hypothetical protein [Gloeothece verrucosa PCC 7822]
MKTLIKWTVDQYHHLIETGILSNHQIELIAVDIIKMSPEGSLHYTIASSGADYLKIFFG